MQKKALCLLLAVIGVLSAFFLSGCGGDDSGVRKSAKQEEKAEDANYKYTVYLITMNQGSNYWKQINDGCEQAAKKLGNVRYVWSAPMNNSDAEQIDCINKAVADGANAIIISVISPTAESEALEKADKAGVKIVYVDTPGEYPAIAFLHTDNEAAGHMAGQTMKKALAEKGITSGTIGIGANIVAKNGIRRVNGFKAEFEGTHFTVANPVEMKGDRRNIKEFVKRSQDYVAFFGANEQISSAMCEQLNDMDFRPVVIGFDTSDYMLTQIKNGIMYATMQQKPKQMGHDGLMLAVDALEGKFKEKNKDIDLGVDVITRDKI